MLSLKAGNNFNLNFTVISDHFIFRIFKNSELVSSFLINKQNIMNVKTEEHNKFTLSRAIYNFFTNWLFKTITSCGFGWIVRFTIIGYHFVVKASRKKRMLKLRMGFRYKLMLVLPQTIEVFHARRRFTVLGYNFKEMMAFCKYIRNLRNLFPYKRKGLAFSSEKLKLKAGKKVKTR